jgi:hypothetical protein
MPAMANRLGPIDVFCDSPPYSIVRACSRVGIKSPEDVRWLRMSHYLTHHVGWRDILKHQPWKVLLGMSEPERQKVCNCRQKLPVLEKYTFTLITGNEVSYLIGQCGRCRTVYWEPA